MKGEWQWKVSRPLENIASVFPSDLFKKKASNADTKLWSSRRDRRIVKGMFNVIVVDQVLEEWVTMQKKSIGHRENWCSAMLLGRQKWRRGERGAKEWKSERKSVLFKRGQKKAIVQLAGFFDRWVKFFGRAVVACGFEEKKSGRLFFSTSFPSSFPSPFVIPSSPCPLLKRYVCSHDTQCILERCYHSTETHFFFLHLGCCHWR